MKNTAAYLTALALTLASFSSLPAQDTTNAPASTPAATNAPTEDHPLDDAHKLQVHQKKNPALPTLFLVGDSTMRNGTKGQEGWGDEMSPFFDTDKINVVNDAIGGRSSRTFQTEGRWDAVLAMVQKGDFVVIEFGHNDPGPVNDTSRARGSIKGLGDQTQEIDNLLTKKHEVVHTFGWYMTKYVTDIQAKGATPIVMSLTPRNSWKDGKAVRAAGENYGGWAEQVAKATGAVFVDHNEIIAEGLDGMGQTAGDALFADHKLHTSHDGAVLNAKMAVSGLKAIAGNPFGPYLSPAADSVPAFKPATSPTP
jgi:rhamnogalacturonan acetylesterase